MPVLYFDAMVDVITCTTQSEFVFSFGAMVDAGSCTTQSKSISVCVSSLYLYARHFIPISLSFLYHFDNKLCCLQNAVNAHTCQLHNFDSKLQWQYLSIASFF
jgi:hypothetical protein